MYPYTCTCIQVWAVGANQKHHFRAFQSQAEFSFQGELPIPKTQKVWAIRFSRKIIDILTFYRHIHIIQLTRHNNSNSYVRGLQILTHRALGLNDFEKNSEMNVSESVHAVKKIIFSMKNPGRCDILKFYILTQSWWCKTGLRAFKPYGRSTGLKTTQHIPSKTILERPSRP